MGCGGGDGDDGGTRGVDVRFCGSRSLAVVR